MELIKNFLQTRDISRMIVVLLFAWYFMTAALQQNSWHLIDSVNLVIHEAGHTIFFFFGEFFGIAAGSGFQVFIPLVFVLYFFLRAEFFSSSILLFWVGESLVNVSVYIGDAVVMQLPLLGGDGTIHDWNYLLSHTGLLPFTPLISLLIFISGFMCMSAAIFWGIMFATNKK